MGKWCYVLTSKTEEELERNTMLIEAKEKVIRKFYERGITIKEISEIVNKTEEEIKAIIDK